MTRRPVDAVRPQVGDLYVSNHGAGGHRARIVRVDHDTVQLRLVTTKQTREWVLPLWFLVGDSCGWTRQAERVRVQ